MERREQKNFLRILKINGRKRKKVDESNVAKFKKCLEKIPFKKI